MVGETAIDVTVSGGTVMAAVPVAPFNDAVTFVEPEALAVTKPLELTAATDEIATAHVAVELTLAVEPSLYCAVATNCSVAPTVMFALAGETETDFTVFVVGCGVGVVPRAPLHPVLAIKSDSERKARIGNRQ